MRETLKQKIVTFLIKHPKLEMIFDVLDAIFQKLMLGYVVVVSILFLVVLTATYYTLPTEIKDTFSPIISAVLTAIVIPFLLTFYNRRKDNEIKRFENNKVLYLEIVKLLFPMVTKRGINDDEKKKICDYINENNVAISLFFSPKMIATINSIVNNCYYENSQNLLYFSKKLIKQIRKESGNSALLLEIIDSH